VAALAQQLEQLRLPSAAPAAGLANSAHAADSDWYRRSQPLSTLLAAK